jgi:hypothetical protein
LFIAFDSPNRGAEIPMSLQALLSYLADQFEPGNQLLANLSSMAARQLLLSSVVLDRDFMLRPGLHLTRVSQVILDYENPNDPRNITASAHATFMADINRPDFRANIKNIVHPVAGGQEPIYMAAIINGSGIGLDLGYTEDLLYATGSSATKLGLDKLDVELRTAMPRSEVTVFYGDVNPHGIPGGPDKDAFTYNFEEPAFVENAPGGLRNTYWQVIGLVNAARYPWKDVDERFCAEDVPLPCRKLTSGPRGNHSFIPSISGAGILNRDINNNTSFTTRTETSGACPGATQFCMFDEFRAPMTNQRHVAVTQENKQWFLELIRTRGPQAAVQPIAGAACAIDEVPLSSLRARFGYNNPNAFDVIIMSGENNRFTGQGIREDEGQPELFEPGQHNEVFQVIFGGISGRGVPAWTLSGTTVEPSVPDPPRPCPPFFGQLSR